MYILYTCLLENIILRAPWKICYPRLCVQTKTIYCIKYHCLSYTSYVSNEYLLAHQNTISVQL